MEFGWGFVHEIVGLLKPEPATQREKEASATITPADYAIYSEKLGLICEEAKEIFVRSGRTGMLLAGDLVVGLYTAQGDMVTAMAGAYIHAVTGTPPIKYCMRRWKDTPGVGVNEGDIFFENDALFGTLHSSDEAVAMPIFSNGELLAWTVAAVQETEVGADSPGMSTTAKTRFDEGLKAPPVKIGENYQLRPDLLFFMGSMTRTPESHQMDTRARAAACMRVCARIQDLAKEKGNEFVLGLMRRLLDETIQGARAKLKKWNDGKYRCVMFADTLGYTECLQKCALTLIKEGDRCTLDFTEASQETDGSVNSFPHSAVAHAISVLYWGAFSDLPVSSGIFAVIDFKFKRGTFLYPHEWASTMLSPPFLSHVMDTTEVVFAKMMYASEEDRGLVMASLGAPNATGFFGAMNQWGFQVADMHILSVNEMGCGAKHDRDGDDSFMFSHCPWGKAQELEDMEAEVPFIHPWHVHRRNSGGLGRYRGGSGVEYAMMQHHTPWAAMFPMGAHHKFPLTLGIFGGYPGGCSPVIMLRKVDTEAIGRGESTLPRDGQELWTEKPLRGEYLVGSAAQPAMPYFKGELLTIHSSAGGGYGDVLERQPEAVIKDLRDEVICHWTAREVYKVVYDPNTLVVDHNKTHQSRQEEREQRKKRGRPYEDFEKEWLTKKPPEKALELYGRWPDGELIKPIMRL